MLYAVKIMPLFLIHYDFLHPMRYDRVGKKERMQFNGYYVCHFA